MSDEPALLCVTVPGKPRPQGSLTLWTGADGKEHAKYSNDVVAHRNLIVGSLRDQWGDRPALTGAVMLRCEFRFVRPKSHYGTGRNAGRLKSWAPEWMAGMPDTDKLIRAVGDACTVASVVRDDCQITVVRAGKIWAEREETVIEVWAL